MTPAQLLGWCMVAAILAALMNFLLKQVSREYVKKISADNPEFASGFRAFMQFMVRKHRYFGLAAAALFVSHITAVLLTGVTSLTGLAAGSILLFVVGLGLYGFHVNRSPRGRWVNAHRGGAFLLAIAVIAHVLVKAYVFF